MTTQTAVLSPVPAPAAPPAAAVPLAAETAVRLPQSQQKPGRERAPLWDNARFAALFLVLVGHSTLKLIAGSNPSYSVYLFVYVFQVPALVLVSGYFAKATPPGIPQLKRLFTDLVVPYLIFETLWSGIHWAISGHLKLDYTTAWWTLWFLLALCIWRVVLPYLVILRYPLAISVALSVGAGYLSGLGETFSLSRAVALLPFFVLGWRLRQWDVGSWWLALPSRIVWRWRAAAVGLFVALAVTSAVGIVEWRSLLLRRFLLYDESYASFGYDEWWAGAVRLGFIALGALCCFALVMLMPRGATWYSGLGTRTMYIYLLHSLVLYPIRQSGLLSGSQPVWVLVAMIALSFGLAVLLGQPFVKRIFAPIIEPKLGWLFRRSVVEQGPARAT